MKLAVIDLGSNSARLGIYTNDNGFCEIMSKRYNTRLAEGLRENNILQEEPMQRTLKAFCKFRKIIDAEKCDLIKAVSTESLRRAKNSDFFVRQVKDKTGISIEIIDGERESYFGAMAASRSTKYNDFYVLDVGGGSFELSKMKDRKIVQSICLPYGCVVLSEKFNPDTNGNESIDFFLKDVFKKITWINESLPVVVMGGSAKEIAKSVYKGENITDYDGLTAKPSHASLLYERIQNTPVNERDKVFGMEILRADIINAGLSVIVNFLNVSNSGEIVFCTKSIREGVALSILCQHKEK